MPKLLRCLVCQRKREALALQQIPQPIPRDRRDTTLAEQRESLDADEQQSSLTLSVLCFGWELLLFALREET